MNSLLQFAQNSIGIPFKENGRGDTNGWDCWGLCVNAFKLKGIDLNVYEHVQTMDVQMAIDEITQQVRNWIPIPPGEERSWDVIHFRPAHIGIVVKPGRMLHVTAGVDTCLGSYHHPEWEPKILGFYRHGQLS